jgi:acetylornithine deacetylase/succinyl-diaminopimelate desuccinylase-like protein
MTDLVGRIRAYLAGERGRQAAFLAELVKLPSDNPPGDCARHAEQAANMLEDLGLEVERHRVPEAIVKKAGMISATNLIVRHRFDAGPIVVLNAHGDVVPPGEGWTKDPYGAEVINGWMYGRGVAVSKSDFATYTWALLALKELRLALKGTVELHFTYDEEAGGEIGPAWILEKGLSQPNYAIGAGFSYAVVNAHNGCLHLEVEVRGRSAHAAKPSTGIDALEAANYLLAALYAWRRTLAQRLSIVSGIGNPQMTVGLIKGGINTNVVPDRVIFRLDRRMIPDEDPAIVEAELKSVIDGAARAYPAANIEVRRILLAEPLKPIAGSEKLTDILCNRATQVMGEHVHAKGVPLYTDARHYAAKSVPIVLFGAGPHTIEEANAHRADERLPLSDLSKATEVITLTLVDLLTEEG